jgi:hypothetical protein
MSDAETLFYYIEKLQEVGINVPAEVLAAVRSLMEWQLKVHGK